MRGHVGLLALALASGCGGNGGGGRAHGPNGGASASGGTSGSGGTGASGSGSRVPDDIDDDGDTGLDVEDSTLTIGTSPAGPALFWFFTVANTTGAPLCGDRVPARIYASDGSVLAGTPAAGGPFIDATTPGLTATVTGKPYRAEGRPLLDCIPPGEHGLGKGSVTPQTTPFGTAEMQSIIDRAARIEFSYAGLASSDIDGIEPATSLVWLEDLALADGAEGKVVSGTVHAGARLTRWRVDVALFDAGGRITDVVSEVGTGMMEGQSTALELPPSSAAATRFEAYIEAQLLL